MIQLSRAGMTCQHNQLRKLVDLQEMRQFVAMFIFSCYYKKYLAWSKVCTLCKLKWQTTAEQFLCREIWKERKHPGALLPQNNETAAKLLDYYLKKYLDYYGKYLHYTRIRLSVPYFVLNSAAFIQLSAVYKLAWLWVWETHDSNMYESIISPPKLRLYFQKIFKTISTLFHAVVIFSV